MKRTAVILLSLLILISLNVSAAQDKPTVYSQQMTAGAGESQIIYINISDNTGLMGFKIHLAYLKDYIKVKSVSRGTVTQKGSFMDNNGLKEGGFDIVWYNTEETKENGTLAAVYVEVLKDEPFQIFISYSEKDTFNEKYGSVSLDCEAIPSKNYIGEAVEPETTEENVSEEDSHENEETQPVTQNIPTQINEDIEGLIVSKVIDELKIGDINNVSDEIKNEILEKVNSEIEKDYGIENRFSGFQSIKERYKKSLSSMLSGEIASLEKNKSADEVLNEVIEQNGYKRKLNSDTVEKIIGSLEEKGLDTVFSDNLSSGELKNALNGILYPDADDGIGEIKDNHNVKVIVIGFAALIVLLFIVLTIRRIYIFKERRKEK